MRLSIPVLTMTTSKCGLDVSRSEHNGSRDSVFDEPSRKYIFAATRNICSYVNGFMASLVVGGPPLWGLHPTPGSCFPFCHDFEHPRPRICTITVLIVGNTQDCIKLPDCIVDKSSSGEQLFFCS